MPFLRASSTTVAGRMVPSTWQCSSTFGSRSSAVATSTFPSSAVMVVAALTLSLRRIGPLVDLPPQRAHESEIPVALGVVEPVPDHEDAGDVEPLVLDLHV